MYIWTTACLSGEGGGGRDCIEIIYEKHNFLEHPVNVYLVMLMPLTATQAKPLPKQEKNNHFRRDTNFIGHFARLLWTRIAPEVPVILLIKK